MTNRVPLMNGRNNRIKFDLDGIYSFDDFQNANEMGLLTADVLANNDGSGTLEVGTPLNKSTLFDDVTQGLFPSGITTVNQALQYIFIASQNLSAVVIHTFETGTEIPIGGVLVEGITDVYGNEVYSGADGEVFVFCDYQASRTLKICDDYVDLTPTAKTVSFPEGEIVHVNLYATMINPEELQEETVTTSKTIMFARPVTLDAHLIGGGHDGEDGTDNGATFPKCTGGTGGSGGGQIYSVENEYSDPAEKMTLTVGGRNEATSAFGLTTPDGPAGGQGSIGVAGDPVSRKAKDGVGETVQKYGTGAEITTYSGGGGASHGEVNNNKAKPGEGPGGAGDGGGWDVNNDIDPGQNASGIGNGGGGGLGAHGYSISAGDIKGGKGTAGIIYYRWKHTA